MPASPSMWTHACTLLLLIVAVAAAEPWDHDGDDDAWTRNATRQEWRRFQHARRDLLRELRAVCARDDLCLSVFGSMASVDDLTFAFLTRRFDEEAFHLLGDPGPGANWSTAAAHLTPEARELRIRLLLSRLALEQRLLCDGGRAPFFDPASAQLSCICPPDTSCDDPSPSLFLINVAFVLLVILLALRTAATCLQLRLQVIHESRPLVRPPRATPGAPGVGRTPYTRATRDVQLAELVN